MRAILRILLSLTLLLLCCGHSDGQATSSKGTEFWTCYMQHNSGNSGNAGSSMILYITSDVATSGKVEFTDGTAAMSFNVTPNTVTFVPVPAGQYLNGNDQFKKGIHITALKPIAVYAHIYAQSVSGATLLLPVNTMGKNYMSLNYTQLSNSGAGSPSYSVFDIIATDDNTEVEITPTAALIDGKAGGKAFIITLSKGEVYQGLSATDLTGTKIRSISTGTGGCKKLAVFSGSTKIGIGCYNTSINNNMQSLTSDNLFQQVYPTSAWGKNYITVALKDRNYDVYRIVLSDPNTNVTLNGSVLLKNQFVNNLFYDFNSTAIATNVISADKPVQVVQYTPTQNQNNCVTKSETAGDPEMIYLSPIEQGLDRVTLYSTGYHKIIQSYINVVLPTDAVSTFTLDDVDYSSSFKAVPNKPGYSYAQIGVTSGPQSSSTSGAGEGTHNIKASKPFNAIAYGFGSAESYGYAAGTNLADLTERIALGSSDNADDDGVVIGCVNVPYKLQLTIPYKTTNIKWDFKNGKAPIVDAAPIARKTTVKGSETLYTYVCSSVASYPVAGEYSVVATVFNPVDDDCGSYKDIQLDFNIAELPIAKFEKIDNCFGIETSFTDKSDLRNSTAKTWSWDFGDGTKGTTANPKHKYAAPGDYKVTLTVTNENGCLSTSPVQTVRVYGIPQPAFDADKIVCATKPVSFADKSTVVYNNISKRTWDFGDGTAAVTRTNADVFTHTYAMAGKYDVTLTLINDGGCANTIKQTIIVNQLPVVDFTMPDACLADNPQFKDASSIPDNTNYPFTYKWDFGDPNATASNPNTSTEKDPHHRYTQVRDASNPYKITLTVTTKNGCSFSVQKNFVVNGDQPQALFKLNNSNTFCSAEDVLFDNLSTVTNGGKITKIVWYWDVDKRPTDGQTFYRDQFPADNIFKHNYGIFYTPATVQYKVRMEAYSGESCVSQSSTQIITIKANPSATLSQIGGICAEATPVTIAPTVKYNVTGKGTFSGPGITAAGIFDPSKTGPGTFTVRYDFKADNGCDYTETQQITVHPTPTVVIGENFTMLEGSNITLKPKTGGDIRTYKWTMENGSKAVGLDRDDVLNPIASPIENSTYILTVTTPNGCSASSKVVITVLKYPVVPNTFTPNGDGQNDKWEIKYLSAYGSAIVQVFDRSGNQLFYSNGYGTAWDGNYNGAPVPAGTYYFIIDPKKGRKVISGNVTVIR